MLDTVYSSEDKSELLMDYWAINEKNKFIYTMAQLKFKYNLSTHMVEKLVQKLGYAVSDNNDLACPECANSHRYRLRNDFTYLSKWNRVCYDCETSRMENELLTAYTQLSPYLQQFRKIHQNNINKAIYYPQEHQDLNQTLDSLNYLELIYLYTLIIDLKPEVNGKLGIKKFPKFLHEEFYENNCIIKSLIEKNLLFYSMSNNKYLSSDIEMNSSLLLKRTEYQNIRLLCEQFVRTPIVIYNLLWKPHNCSLKKFSELLATRIDSYKINFQDLEIISLYLQQKRMSEIYFLPKVIEYNHNFKIKHSNAFESKTHELCQKYTIKMIYGYFFTAMTFTLIALDFQPDIKRNIIKNSIYNNYIIGNKIVNFPEKNMPRNYRYSKIIRFLEQKHELGTIWMEVPINSFIKLLFEKMDI